MTTADAARSAWPAYGAALWALIFGALHISWALGWYVGLSVPEAQKAFAQPWFLTYDIIVVAICLLAVPIALALVQPWGRRVPRWLLATLAWTGTALLILRAGASAIQIAYLIVRGTFVPHPMHFWELWFAVGAVLFGISTWRFSSAHRRSSVAPADSVIR